MSSMIIDRTETAITFRVDDVEPAGRRLATLQPRDAILDRTGVTIEAASDIVRPFVPAHTHGLVAAAERAFLDHRPLVLGPDAVWQAIAQGFADHVNANPEALRARLVPHQGKKTLVVPMNYLQRSPENPWVAAFTRMAELVRSHSHPEAIAALDVDFSTSTPLERAARAFVLLDAYQAFFEYEMMCICGIPWVRLEGTAADWKLVAEKLEALSRFDLQWWVESLRPVVRGLYRTAMGEPDPAFWRSIYQQREEHGGYGGPTSYVSGWIVRFAPYLGEGERRSRNPICTGEAKEIYPGELPRGFAQVPFKLDCGDKKDKMVALAGILGLEQDETTLALKPKILWAVGAEPKEVALRAPR